MAAGGTRAGSKQTSTASLAASELDHFRFLGRPPGRPTRKYLKKTRPSPAGNSASHFRQAIFPCGTSHGASMLMIRYSASQHGQLKRIGSDLLIVNETTAPEGNATTGASLPFGQNEKRRGLQNDRALPSPLFGSSTKAHLYDLVFRGQKFVLTGHRRAQQAAADDARWHSQTSLRVSSQAVA